VAKASSFPDCIHWFPEQGLGEISSPSLYSRRYKGSYRGSFIVLKELGD